MKLNNNHMVTKEQIVRVWQWDKTVKGFSGGVEYEFNGKRYAPNITNDELHALKDMGFTPESIPTKYSDTY